MRKDKREMALPDSSGRDAAPSASAVEAHFRKIVNSMTIAR
jgi:hypothetical protein